MEEAGAGHSLHLVSWRANGDAFDVALAVNRLLAAGARAWCLGGRHDDVEAGDYVVEISAARAAALAQFGLVLRRWPGGVPDDASPLARPAVRLFAGSASKYPYFAYYALCLLRLGIDYVACDGASLASGTLDDANLLILPGGFATWGIDAAEDVRGADANVRAFLAAGGSAIGSCGGAFYLSAGRPAWTGTAAATPLYSHEYLQSGVAVVAIALREGALARGCPPTMEVPYYHGPIYDLLGKGVDVAATFHGFTLPGRLAIDNPLDRERFDRDMRGKPAILTTSGARGRAVLFSPHPEMGDLVRKYIALDGYVRRYLPIRGAATMRDTLRHYRVTDAPSFRLVLNAVQMLCDARYVPERAANGAPASPAPVTLTGGLAACRRALDALSDAGSGDEGDLLRDVAAGIETRLARVTPPPGGTFADLTAAESLAPSWRHLASAIAEHRVAADATRAQRLMDADLAVSLIECWTRVAGLDRALARAAA